MSRFYDIVDDQFLKDAELLSTKGSTCWAYRVEVNGKQQFLKRLRPQYQGNPRYVAAFTKEFMTGRQLEHLHLVKYNEINTTADGVCMLLDYVAGDTVTKRLEEQPQYFLKEDHLHRFVTQLLSCLSYLHAHQVVHLDLKPDNIMLTQVGGDVKVLDLGFCYTDTYCTTTGKTDRYAAPEQKEGEIAQIDARTDLYAVGSILREIETKQGCPVPKPYKQLMNRCLEEKKEDRPASASACLKIIQRRHRVLWTSVIASVILAIFLVGWFSAFQSEKWKQAQLPRTPQGRVYDFMFHEIYYRILSEDSLTCEAVEWDTSRRQIDPNIWIYKEVAHNQKSYQVISIADSAFYLSTDAQTAYIPEGVTHLGTCSFSKCYKLEVVNIPNSVSSFSPDIFADCSALTSITIPNSVTSIGEESFRGCEGLTSVTIPNGVTSIEYGAFSNCYGLTSIYVDINSPLYYDGIFIDAQYDLCTLYVPVGSKSAYKNAEGWNNFTNIVEFDFSTAINALETRANNTSGNMTYDLLGNKFDTKPKSGIYITRGRKYLRK